MITRSRHKDECNRRASELRDEALFKDPPPKEGFPICFLPMPLKLMCCASLPDATITSVPIYDFAIANEEVAKLDLEEYFPCCGKSSCGGCVHSFRKSENIFTCPFCKSERGNKTDEEQVEEVLKRVEANDPASICLLANIYYRGEGGLQQDQVKAMELFTKSAELGFSKAHYLLGHEYYQRGDLKKTNFHYEAAAIAGHELARFAVGIMDEESENMERAAKHLRIAASTGDYNAMHHLRKSFEFGYISRESINSTMIAYNSYCAEMRSEARDAYITNLSTYVEYYD